MKKLKKTFKRIGSVFAVLLLILLMTILPTLALTISIEVTYLNSGYGLCEGLFFKTSDASTYTRYDEGDTIVAVTEYNAAAYLSLTTEAINQGFTGFVIYLTESETYNTSQNLIPSYCLPDHIVSLADGSYYVADDAVFYFYKNTPYLYFAAVPVNLQYYMSNQSQNNYDRGYAEGISDQQDRINELESTVSMLQNQSTTASQAYSSGKNAGLLEAKQTSQFVQNMATVVVDGTGNIFQEMFKLEVLGIKLYQVALLCAFIPLIIFFVKVSLRH